MENSFNFFSNKECKHFPCHEVENEDEFNCLFCFCPLYALGDKCGGNFKYVGDGVKDCSNCIIPHTVKAHDYIIGKWDMISELAKENS